MYIPLHVDPSLVCGRLLYTVERVSAYWPAAVRPGPVRALLLGQLARAAGDLLAITLETLRRGSQALPGLLSNLTPELAGGRLLGNPNVAVQRNTLELLAALLPELLEDSNGGPFALRVRAVRIGCRVYLYLCPECVSRENEPQRRTYHETNPQMPQ